MAMKYMVGQCTESRCDYGNPRRAMATINGVEYEIAPHTYDHFRNTTWAHGARPVFVLDGDGVIFDVVDVQTLVNRMNALE